MNKSGLNKYLFIYFLSTLVVGVILILFILRSYTLEKAKIKYLDYFSKAGRIEYLNLPEIGIKAFKSNFNRLEKIKLEIDLENLLILENIRKKSIVRGSLPVDDDNIKVKFKLNHKNKSIKGKIRLKGDRPAHFRERDKSSYKIELTDNNYFLGLKKFSLQKPRIRNYIHEWIFHQMAKDFGLIKIKYEFLKLNINGENKGLYVVEEGFGKELIERNERRNGPIFGLNEFISSSSRDPIFEIYNKKYWERSENINLAQTAVQKLKDFYNDKIPLEDIFDLEKWASFLAITDMTSAYHGALLWNVKLYYNPINELFEPIPYDGHRNKPNYHKYNINYDNRIIFDLVDGPTNTFGDDNFYFFKKFFYTKNKNLNLLFYDLYIAKLNIVSSSKYLNKFIQKNLNQIEKINSKIYADYFYYDNALQYGPGLYYFSLSDFFQKAENIKIKTKNKKKMQIIKKNKSEFLVKNYYKNYGALIIDEMICSKGNQNITIKIEKKLNNFSNTSIKLSEEQLENLKCTHVNFIDKFNKSSFSIKIDYISSQYN